jgi:hypothetical protein
VKDKGKTLPAEKKKTIDISHKGCLMAGNLAETIQSDDE